MDYTIDRKLLEKYLIGFREVLTANGDSFSLTAANSVYKDQEFYKYRIAETVEQLLKRSEWKEEDIGTKKIFQNVKEAMDASGNLVYVTNRLHFYDDCEANLEQSERALFKLFRSGDDEAAFGMLTEAFGKVYDVIGYLYFIHDSKRYLPIASSNFDERFEKIGIDYRMSHRCSWENYRGFIRIIRDIRDEMQDYYDIDGITLLDAHSFIWMFWKIDEYYETVAAEPYITTVHASDSEAIVHVRNGQSQYRKNLLSYWGNSCSVTGCTNVRLLKASHIKPWSDSDNIEKGDVYNGLLLTPNLDAAFDRGFISFSDDGRIMISGQLSDDDCLKLGINDEMKLCKITDQHRKYLEFHRKHVFRLTASEEE